MVNLSTSIPILLLACSVVASVKGNSAAKISLFEASITSEAHSACLTLDLECGSDQPSADIVLAVDNCFWGDYFLVNNFKIATYPTCENGAKAVALFYATTSCTGMPTYRSDKAAIDPSDQCLFGSSSEKWSMIFRCENFDSQSVPKGNFIQAVPPPSSSPKEVSFTKPKPIDGVVTPYFSYDCISSKPKEPTVLPADTCLTLEVGHSLYVTQPVVCSDGKAALAETYKDAECASPDGWLGIHAFSDSYLGSVDKKCHSTNARSFAFRCSSENDMKKFEGLPPHKPKDVEALIILPSAHPSTHSNLPSAPKKLASVPKHQVSIGGFAYTEENGGDKLRVEITPSPKKLFIASSSPRGGTIQSFYLKKCKHDGPMAPNIALVDTCVVTFMYDSMRVASPAICASGTQALVATYARPGCHAADLQSFGELPSVYEDCANVEKIGSLAFWCEGLPETKIGNTVSFGGLIKFLLLMLLFAVVMICLTALSYCLRGRAMMQQMMPMLEKIQALFKKGEGEIQL